MTVHETKPFFMLNLAYLRYSKITYFGFLVTYFATFGYIKMSYFGMKKYIFYLSLLMNTDKKSITSFSWASWWSTRSFLVTCNSSFLINNSFILASSFLILALITSNSEFSGCSGCSGCSGFSLFAYVAMTWIVETRQVCFRFVNRDSSTSTPRNKFVNLRQMSHVTYRIVLIGWC